MGKEIRNQPVTLPHSEWRDLPDLIFLAPQDWTGIVWIEGLGYIHIVRWGNRDVAYRINPFGTPA